MGKLDQFVAGAKTWMSPSQIPEALKTVFNLEAWKAAPMMLLGLLAVPAAVLAVVMGMGAAKRRRTRNPRRGAGVRRQQRRVANPRRRRNTNWTTGYVVYPGGYGYPSLAKANAKAKRVSTEEGHAYVENTTNAKTVSSYYNGRKQQRRVANPRRRRRRNPRDASPSTAAAQGR
jgi:hypothetical protein